MHGCGVLAFSHYASQHKVCFGDYRRGDPHSGSFGEPRHSTLTLVDPESLEAYARRRLRPATAQRSDSTPRGPDLLAARLRSMTTPRAPRGLRVLEGVRRSTMIQRLLKVPGIRAAQQAVGVAHRFCDPLRYLGGELTDAGRRAHRLRDSGMLVEQRYRDDRQVLYEVFVLRVYDPPSEPAAVLAAIRRPLNVVDLGANVGCFTLRALELFDVGHVTAIEPDPANAELLRAAVRVNRLEDRVEVVRAAGAVEDGVVNLRGGLNFNSYVTEDGSGDSVPARDAFALMAEADLVKIDIEGSEWALLADPRLFNLSASAITMEWHGTRGQVRDPEGTAVRRLEAAGYKVRSQAQTAEAVGNLWAWRTPGL